MFGEVAATTSIRAIAMVARMATLTPNMILLGQSGAPSIGDFTLGQPSDEMRGKATPLEHLRSAQTLREENEIDTRKEKHVSNNITISLPDLKPVKAEVLGIVEAAKAITIATTEDRNRAAEFERALIRKEKAVAAHYKPIKKSLDAHKRVILDQERSYLAPLQDARGVVRRTELAWDTEQQRIADEEREKMEAEIRQRKEEEQVVQMATAEAAGDDEEAKAIMERPIEIPKIDIKAPKPRGQSVRITWKVEVMDFQKLLAHIVANPALTHLVRPDDQAIRAMARTQKDKLSLPGVRVYSEKSLSTTL